MEQSSFFKTAGAVVEISPSLQITNLTKLSLPKSMKLTGLRFLFQVFLGPVPNVSIIALQQKLCDPFTAIETSPYELEPVQGSEIISNFKLTRLQSTLCYGTIQIIRVTLAGRLTNCQVNIFCFLKILITLMLCKAKMLRSRIRYGLKGHFSLIHFSVHSISVPKNRCF